MDNARFLKAIGLFSELPDPVVGTLAEKMLELNFAKNQHICKENDQGNALFVIKDGIVQIYVGEGPEKKVLAYLKRGDYFGEMAIFSGDPRSASATALADVTVLGLMKDAFEAEVQRSPTIALELLKTLSRRLAKANAVTGGGESKSGRVLFLAGSEKGAGKTTVARDLAASLAEQSEARVILLDPNVQNGALAESVGVKERCDLAHELVSSDALTVERYVTKTPWGFWVLMPQKIERTTYPLRESHHHVLMNALAEKFDYLVVDSSSTMAQFNKHLMQSAARIVVVLSGAQESLSSFLQPFQNLVLDQAQVDRRKVLYLFNQNRGVVSDARARLGDQEVLAKLPHDPSSLVPASEQHTPAVALHPEGPWAKALEELARTIYREHSLDLFLPLEPAAGGVSEERARSEAEHLSGELEKLFGEPPEVCPDTLVGEGEDEDVPALAVRLRATSEKFNAGMDGFLQQATACRDRLGLEGITVRVDGRPSVL